MKNYLHREDGVKIEALTKDETEALVASEETSADEISSIVETNKQKAKKFWLGTEKEYEKVSQKDADVLYFIRDNSYFEDVEDRLKNSESNATLAENEIGILETKIAGIKDASLQKLDNIIVSDINTFNGAVESIKGQLQDVLNNAKAKRNEFYNAISNIYSTKGGKFFLVGYNPFNPSTTSTGFNVYYNFGKIASNIYKEVSAEKAEATYGYFSEKWYSDLKWNVLIGSGKYYISFNIYFPKPAKGYQAVSLLCRIKANGGWGGNEVLNIDYNFRITTSTIIANAEPVNKDGIDYYFCRIIVLHDTYIRDQVIGGLAAQVTRSVEVTATGMF